jgi:hypothetical protein
MADLIIKAFLTNVNVIQLSKESVKVLAEGVVGPAMNDHQEQF